jgi:hypothetical protein
MSRTIALSLLLLISVGIMLPFAGSTAHGIRHSSQFHHHRHRHHSRAWWRRYRTRMRRRHAAALAHRNSLLPNGLPQNISLNDPSSLSVLSLPIGSVNNAASEQLKFPVNDASVSLPGQMALSVVALSRPNPAFLTVREEKRMLAGVAVSDLRRIVIDKMIVAGGWVTNDFVRDMNGSRVFVVTAQTPKDAHSAEKAWNFYFTEAGGRIYGLTTNSPLEFADRMVTEAERFIGSIHSNSNSQPSNR